MRENCTYGSAGGEAEINRPSLPRSMRFDDRLFSTRHLEHYCCEVDFDWADYWERSCSACSLR